MSELHHRPFSYVSGGKTHFSFELLMTQNWTLACFSSGLITLSKFTIVDVVKTLKSNSPTKQYKSVQKHTNSFTKSVCTVTKVNKKPTLAMLTSFSLAWGNRSFRSVRKSKKPYKPEGLMIDRMERETGLFLGYSKNSLGHYKKPLILKTFSLLHFFIFAATIAGSPATRHCRVLVEKCGSVKQVYFV